MLNSIHYSELEISISINHTTTTKQTRNIIANLEITNLCFNVLLFPLSIWISSLRLVCFCFLGYDL